jgi:hypothetical protein
MGEIVPSVSGTSMSTFTDALRDIYGQAWVDAGLARLDSERRMQVQQSTALMWIPLETLRLAVDAWSEASGVSANEITRLGVQLAVKKSFATVWRLLLTFTTDSALIARVPMLWNKSRNVGHAVAEIRGTGHGRITLTGFPNPTDRQIYSVSVAIATFLELTGRKPARCNYRLTHDGAIFDATWGTDPNPRRA